MGAAEWPRLAPAIWQTVAACLRVNRLARQARVADTGTRDSRAVLLLGSDGWVRACLPWLFPSLLFCFVFL